MNQVIENQKLQCYHCRDKISGPAIIHDDHEFCCDGCKIVYTILAKNDMCEYYDLNDSAGISFKGKSSLSYHFLDDQEMIDRLSVNIAPNLNLSILSLPQIHCSSCIWLLEKLYKFNDGIYSSKVDFIRREIEIKYDPQKVSLRIVVELIDKLGYTPDFHHDVSNNGNYDQSLKLKIGIAGFVFGNVMLFSFPEYLGLDDEYFKIWFGYLNLILGAPLLIFCGKDYITQAWTSIKYRTYNINIPLALGMIVMYAVSVWFVLSQKSSGYIDSLAGLIFFLLIGRWYQQRSFHFLSFERDYKSYFPISCSRILYNNIEEIAIDKIEEGDKLLIRNEQIIPVDGILISDITSIDYSFVTGEETPIIVSKGEKIFAGGKLKDANIELAATSIVKNSYLVSLWNNVTFDKKEKDYTIITDKLSRYFTLSLLIIAFVSLIYWFPISIDKAIRAFTSVLIVACPCAIALTVPFIYGNLMRLFSRSGIFLKNANVIDMAADVKKIVFDKTGTITTQLDKEIIYHGVMLDDESKMLIHALTFQSSHPLSVAIEKALRANTIYNIDHYKEIPGEGIEGICKGKLIKIGSSKFIGEINKTQGTVAHISIDHNYVGYFIFKNQYRHYLKNVVRSLKSQKKMISILSGDNDKEKTNLQEIIGSDIEMSFNCDPHQKLNYIDSLQKEHKVAMIGDGLNDSGALKKSDLGIVIAESNNNFTPACDVILRADNFKYIPSFFGISKASRYLIMGAYIIAIIYNILGLNYAVQGMLSPVIAAILMPLSSFTIIIYATVSSNLLYKYWWK